MVLVDDSFWPKDIGPDIKPPSALLRPRAKELTAITSGILVGDIVDGQEGDWSSHRLDVIVPALNDFRQGLLSVKHLTNKVYPAFVEAPNFRSTPPLRGMKGDNQASSDVELAGLLKTALHSDKVRSLLASLIAQANERIQGSPDVAIAAVKHGRDGARIDYFRVHLPFDGHFGSPVTDAQRESVIEMILTEHKSVVTIREENGTFAVAAAVRLTPNGYLRIDEQDVEADDLGDLPEIDQPMTRI